MEIQLNKDLQKFQDNFVLGLNFRQTLFAGTGVVLGAATYFLANRAGLHTEIAGWLCAIVAAPFAALGFVTANGMPFERLVKAWIKQYILCPKHIVSRLENYDYEIDKPKIEAAQEKEAHRRD